VHSLPVVLGSVSFNWLSLHSHFRSDAAFGPSLSFLVTEILQNTHFGSEICEFKNSLLLFGSYSWVKSTGYIQGPSRGLELHIHWVPRRLVPNIRRSFRAEKLYRTIPAM
jgi:hypothetical protein